MKIKFVKKRGWRDLKDQRFDKLVVIKRIDDYIYPSTGRHEPKWLCKCDCGNTIEVIHHNLLNGHVHCCKECKSNKLIDMIGKKFGKLTVLERAEDFIGTSGRETQWFCKCDCGNNVIVRGHNLRNGHTKSCGCAQIEVSTKHGWHGTPIYEIYHNMKSRCYNPNYNAYKDYGGRGISICDEWLNPDTGVDTFCKWSMANGYKPGLSIDRINNDGNYCPENCRWTDGVTQANNRRNNIKLTLNGITHTAAEWEPIVGISAFTLYARKEDGWSDERALTEPVNAYMRVLTDSNGESHTISDWSKITGLDRGLIYDRHFRQGWSVDKSLYEPISDSRKPKLITYNDDTFSYNQWGKLMGFGPGTVSKRIRSGKSIEESLTTPISNNGKIIKPINGIYFIDPKTNKPIPQDQVGEDDFIN